MSRFIAISSICLASSLFGCGPGAEPGPGVDPEALLLYAVPFAPEVRTGDACETPFISMSCGDEGTEVRFCDNIGGELEWGPCIAAATMECAPGDASGGCQVCDLYGGVPAWDYGSCGGTSTPLVLRFDEAPIAFTPMGAVGFDIDGVGACEAFDFPVSRDTPWLAVDRDGNGTIENGTELFGSGTVLADGRRAPNGFVALAELDANGDRRIDASDAGFGTLLTWADHDEDRVGSGLELQGLDASGLVSIELSYRVDSICDARGNCGIERAAFTWRDRFGALSTGEVVDVHLPCR